MKVSVADQCMGCTCAFGTVPYTNTSSFMFDIVDVYTCM